MELNLAVCYLVATLAALNDRTTHSQKYIVMQLKRQINKDNETIKETTF